MPLFQKPIICIYVQNKIRNPAFVIIVFYSAIYFFVFFDRVKRTYHCHESSALIVCKRTRRTSNSFPPPEKYNYYFFFPLRTRLHRRIVRFACRIFKYPVTMRIDIAYQ